MLDNIIVSEVRVKILKILLLNSSEAYHVRALVRAVGTEINAVRRELQRLTGVGLLKRRPAGNKIFYSVNTESPLYPELLSLISKEFGLGADIIKSVKKLGDVRYAVLSRAFSRGREPSVLDVDLFLVGDINMDILDEIVKKEERKLNKDINYSVLNADNFEFRKRKGDQFVVKILSQSRTMLVGDEEDFCKV